MCFGLTPDRRGRRRPALHSARRSPLPIRYGGLPEVAVDPVEVQIRHRGGDSSNDCRGQVRVVGEVAHERHPTGTSDRGDRVSAQHDASAIGTRPDGDGAAGEVSAKSSQ